MNKKCSSSRKNTCSEIAEFVDRYVSARLPSQEDEKLFTLVNQVQRNTHSASCRKTGKICRFNFPKPITSTTLVTPPSTDHPEETPEQKSQKKQHLKRSSLQ